MYSSCIFCSRFLGRNETLETFPVGRVVAFDASKGRLWAVCPACGRWNLAPLRERWEAVEDAERRFRGTRLRVQSENIGVAQLTEGMRLVRVGDALPGELAAWRYGGELRGRRRRHRIRQTVEVIVGGLMIEALLLRVIARQKEIVYRVAGDGSPTGEPVLIREKNLRGTRVQVDGSGEMQVALPRVFSLGGRMLRKMKGDEAPRGLALSGRPAHDLISRAMVRVNAPGAGERDLSGALELMDRLGSKNQILSEALGGSLLLAERRWTVTKPLEGRGAVHSRSGRLLRPALLAFEMALHDETERRALEGDLEALEERWREAEEIAAIADALPEGPLPGVADGRGPRR